MCCLISRYFACFVVVFSLATSGCRDKQAKSSKTVPMKHKARPEQVLYKPDFEGTILEVTNADKITYALVNTTAEDKWVGMPRTVLKPGQKISVANTLLMTNVSNKMLGRRFDKMYFTPDLECVVVKLPANEKGKSPRLQHEKDGPTCELAEACSATNAAATTVPEPAATPKLAFMGTVTEVLQGGPYTYVEVVNGSNMVWGAAPTFPVNKGDKVAVPISMPARNFSSPALQRIFDLLYMADSIPVLEKAK